MWNVTGVNNWIVPTGVSSVEYLVIGGAGSGGVSHGGGGGAGAFRTATGYSVTAGTGLNVTVGSGGAPVTSGSAAAGLNGTPSVFGTITSDGGGGGGPLNGVGLNGGSGGGGGGNGGSVGGTATNGGSYGNNGGAGQTGGNGEAGGGGGKGSTGSPGTSGGGGNGGTGLQSNITGTLTYYSAGGGGEGYAAVGTGGSGVGGNGSGGGAGCTGVTSGINGTGSGGGGCSGTTVPSGRGGNGIVIISYQMTISPIPSFTSNITSPAYSPFTVRFNDTSITNPTAWNWSYQGIIGGNNTQTWWSQIQNATGVFTTGNYTINLNVTNASGSATTSSNYWINVSATTPPVASFTKDKTGGTSPLVVTFTDTTTNTPTSWLWVFGDGSTENNTAQNPKHTFTGAGTYNVNLTATNTFGSNTSATQAITTGTIPVASFTANTSFGAPPLGVQFNDTSTDTVAMSAWNWSFQNVTGNNTQVWFSTTQNATHGFGVGNYKIVLNATNTYGTNISTQTTWVNATTFQADFTGTPLSGYSGTNVAFTESNTGYTADNRTWNFGDGNTSTSTNPSHIYNFNGNFNVNLTVYNSTAGFSSKLRSGYITISDSGGLSGWNRQDIMMEGMYTLTLDFKDSITHAPIPIVQVLDSNGGNQTTSTGQFVGSYNYSVIVIYASSTGYASISRSYVMDEDRSATIYLSAVTPQPTQNPQQNTIWTPPQVVFQVLDNNNNPIVGTPVWANAEFTTLPGGMASALGIFSSAFGLSNSTAGTILNQSTNYYGTTDSSGSVVFMMVPVISYNVTAQDTNGVNYSISIMPKDQYYQIKTKNATFENQAVSEIAYINNSRNSIFNTSFYEPSNGTIGVMDAEIYDSTGKTAGANCWWTLIDNQTTWWDNRSWALGSGLKIINKTVPIVPYQQWQWGCQTI